MKENIIQFHSYLIYDLIMNDGVTIDGEFYSCFDNSVSKIEIIATKLNEDPKEIIPWGRKINVPIRLINTPFAISHPYLGKYSFVIKNYRILFTSERKVPLLYKMLSMAKIRI